MENEKLRKEINTLTEIINDEFKVNIMEKTRKREVVRGRMVFTKIMFDKGFGYTEIGRFLRKTHATVMRYLENFPIDYEYNYQFRQAYTKCYDIFYLAVDPLYEYTNIELLMEIYAIRHRLKTLLGLRHADIEHLDKAMDADKRMKKIFDIVRENTPYGSEERVAHELSEFFRQNSC